MKKTFIKYAIINGFMLLVAVGYLFYCYANRDLSFAESLKAVWHDLYSFKSLTLHIEKGMWMNCYNYLPVFTFFFTTFAVIVKSIYFYFIKKEN